MQNTLGLSADLHIDHGSTATARRFWCRFTLDPAKLTKLIDGVAMTTATRQEIVEHLTRWEADARQEAKAAADARAAEAKAAPVPNVKKP
jgi:hypothetical protein